MPGRAASVRGLMPYPSNTARVHVTLRMLPVEEINIVYVTVTVDTVVFPNVSSQFILRPLSTSAIDCAGIFTMNTIFSHTNAECFIIYLSIHPCTPPLIYPNVPWSSEYSLLEYAEFGLLCAFGRKGILVKGFSGCENYVMPFLVVCLSISFLSS